MPVCSVDWCTNRATQKLKQEKGISFHSFPSHIKQPTVREKWINFVRMARPTFFPTVNSRICSEHFTEDMLKHGHDRPRLRDDAMPTKMGHGNCHQEIVKGKLQCQKRKLTEADDEYNPDPIVSPKKHPRCFVDQPAVHHDHTYVVTKSPRKLKRQVNYMLNQHNKIKKKLQASQKKTKRLKKKISSLNDVVKELKKENLISVDSATVLENTFSGVPKEMVKRLVQQKKGQQCGAYPPELRSFALTLKFYSTKAYKFVRKTFNLGLPHPSVIRSWYSKVDGGPGFTKAAFSALSAKVASAKESNQEILCNLVFDEMSIRKDIHWDGKRFSGFVDYGTGIEDDSLPAATEALVLMAVSINDKWKVPCGYFFIDGLSSLEKANLVKTCLEKLYDSGVKVASLTCDGPSVNLALLKALGATVKPHQLTPFFSHPSDPSHRVHIILDVCHMLKLVRNTLGDLKVLIDKDGNHIQWQYLQHLHNLQESQGLHLANKLRLAHIKWQPQKMKVNLAAQTLSASVADSIDYCREHLKLPQFANSEATTQFLRIFDRLFDILNSRNPLAKNYKAPLRLSNFKYVEKFMIDADRYISNLKDSSGKLIITARRKTGFLGFLMAIKSTRALFMKLVASHTPKMKYLLMYKFSQDHIELFFAAIRAAGGWNNNPTTVQFTSAYKQLLMRHMIEGGHGNCTAQDDTKILDTIEDQCNINLVQTGVSDVLIARRYDLKLREEVDVSDQLCPISNNAQLSLYKDAVISYVAGFVAKMVTKKIGCPECISALTQMKETANQSFVTWKSNGGLVIPSESLLQICKETEKCFMRMMNSTSGKLPHGPGIPSAISTTVLSSCIGSNIFDDLTEHMFDTTATNNHIASLIKCASQSYTQIRMHHLAKSTTEQMLGRRVRKKLSKLILFSNQ